MTAHAMSGDQENCLKAGMNDYVSKPIQPQKLFEAIEKQIIIDDEEKEEREIMPEKGRIK
jgi:CheY-like chemotaxis protein